MFDPIKYSYVLKYETRKHLKVENNFTLLLYSTLFEFEHDDRKLK
jgi:hypothetical protein